MSEQQRLLGRKRLHRGNLRPLHEQQPMFQQSRLRDWKLSERLQLFIPVCQRSGLRQYDAAVSALHLEYRLWRAELRQRRLSGPLHLE
jgi:hypothetical protein